ncbi:nuclear transport factor 2 family protein [Algiphilus sp.]|uniref:nuclear transport factor 2 family protein n=1 Tax=Algiphilus sp. TaxID=1872431 RepID=UPI0032EB9975
MSSKDRVAAMLACVHASPEAVARHDRTAWLGLFSPDAEIHDPVGARPHCGAIAIARFYDTFIAPNRIVFEVAYEGVCDDTVWRDVTIHTHMATGLSLRVPAHLRYQLRAQPSGPCYIRRLCAHWELGSMLGQSLRSGWLGLRSNAGLTRHLLACQGMTGAIGFTRGLGGVGRRGRGRAERLFTALRDGDKAAASAQCAPQPTFHVDGVSLASIDALIEHARGLQWRKLIAAARQVTASIETASGHGIALLTFDKRGRVVQLRWEF